MIFKNICSTQCFSFGKIKCDKKFGITVINSQKNVINILNYNLFRYISIDIPTDVMNDCSTL